MSITHKTALRVMKLTAVLLTICCLCLPAAAETQTVSYSGRNVTLKQIFTAIKKQTGYLVVYNAAQVDASQPITINAKDQPLAQFLTAVLNGLDLSYSIESKTIVISHKEKKANPISPNIDSKTDFLPPPPIDIKGRVTDESGRPVIGASVQIKGTNKGTTTNNDGEFAIAGVDEKAVLVISAVNIETREILVDGRKEINLIAKAKVSQLVDVEITAVSTGYQTISKERSVGSFSKVDSSLYHREVSSDIISRLNGITNGLLFDRHIGSVQSLQIRGISTLQSSREPLIVLDNFPYYGDINNINPNDILDVTVLKDAAAASVWGAKAGNGVIVITTKKGKFNQPLRLQLTSNITVTQKPDLFYFPQMSSSDFIDVESFLFTKGAYTSTLSNTTTRPIVSPVVEILNKQKNGQITQTEADAQINALRLLDVRNDYTNYVYRNAINQQNYLNISGGSNTINYNFSGGFDNNLSAIQTPGTNTRYSLNAATTFKPTRWVEFTTAVIFNQSEQNNDNFSYPLNPTGGKSQIYPYAQFADASGNHLTIPYKYRLSYLDTVGQGKLLDWHYRPLDELENQNNRSKNQYTLINIGARVNLLSWLSGEVRYQYGSQVVNQEQLNDINSFYTRDLINSYTNLKSTVPTIRNPVPIGGIFDKSTASQTSQNFRGQLNISKNWKGVHEISGLIATEVNQIRTQNFSGRLYGFNASTLLFFNQIDYNTSFPTYVTGSSSQVPTGSNNYSNTVNKSVSFLTNGSYRYKGRYTIYVSARKDGSNFFGVSTNNRWKPLWSAGAGWDLSKESFYNVGFLPQLRLRASYGYTGNINNSIPAVTIISYSGTNPITATPTANLSFAQNPELRWEQVRIVNIGVDFGLLKNRLSGSIEWFDKKSSDVIARFPVDPTLGITLNQTTLNAANLSANGLDVQLNTRNLEGIVTWSTSLNFSYAKTLVTNYFQNPVTGIPTIGDINPIKGQIAWGLYAYRWAGLDPVTGDPQGYLAKQVSKNYTAIISDSIQNHVLIGSSLPLYFGNILNSVSFKGFELSANIIYKFAYFFRRPTIQYNNLFNSWIGNNDYSKRWQAPGDENMTNVPSMIYPGNSNRDGFYQNSEVNVEKGDNIKLSDLRLSYNIGNRQLKRLPLKGIQVFAYLNNLNIYLWRASKSGLNPDFGTSTIPPQRSIAFGLNLKF